LQLGVEVSKTAEPHDGRSRSPSHTTGELPGDCDVSDRETSVMLSHRIGELFVITA